MDKIEIISETQAAKIMRVKNAQRFFELFVLKGKMIEPIVYPDSSRRRYLKKEVEELPERCKISIKTR